jgi:protein-tyrosine phosphatase
MERGVVVKPHRESLPMAVRVLPNIYLGDSRAAQSEGFFNKAKISAVLNMTPSLANTFCAKSDIEYMRIPVYDSHGKRDQNAMYQYFPVITEFIYKVAVLENKNLLVHCALGRQRSVSAIVAYIMKFYKMTPVQAMEFMLKRKPDAFHWGEAVNFAKSINKWHWKLNPERDNSQTS